MRTLVVVRYLKSEKYSLAGPISWMISGDSPKLIRWDEFDLSWVGDDIPTLIKEFGELVLAMRERLDTIEEGKMTAEDRCVKNRLGKILIKKG